MREYAYDCELFAQDIILSCAQAYNDESEEIGLVLEYMVRSAIRFDFGLTLARVLIVPQRYGTIDHVVRNLNTVDNGERLPVIVHLLIGAAR